MRSRSKKRTAPCSAGRRSAIGSKPARSHAPQRTCVACRTVRAKRELIRVVRSPDGALGVDLRGKASGRGAYLCPDEACLQRGIASGALAAALETAIEAASVERLESELRAGAVSRRTGR